ncbi:hypothetical protein [Mucilaginibacter sp. HD30]
MRKLIIVCIVLIVSCGQVKQEGLFVYHGKNEFTIGDDTLIIKDGIVTNKVGYNRIRNGQIKPRQFITKQWRLNEPGTPIIIFKNNGVTANSNFYRKVY